VFHIFDYLIVLKTFFSKYSKMSLFTIDDEDVRTQLDEVDYSSVNIPFKDATEDEIESFYYSTGLKHLNRIIKKHFEGISSTYFFEYSLNSSTLDTFYQKLLTFAAVNTNNNEFKENIEEYVSAMINVRFPDTDEGQEKNWFYNPEWFVLPSKINIILLGNKEANNNLLDKKTVKDIEDKVACVREKKVPQFNEYYLTQDKNVYVSNMTYERQFDDVLKWTKTFFDKKIDLLEYLKNEAKTFISYFNHFIAKDVKADKYCLLVFPLIASKNYLLPSIYEKIFSKDELYDRDGKRRFQGTGHFIVYFKLNNEFVDWDKEKNEQVKKLVIEVNNAVCRFVVNYNFNMGMRAQERLKSALTQSAITALMSRNMSHNLGSHVLTNVKHQIEDLEKQQGDESVQGQLRGLTALLQYLQERQDFIATIANDEFFPKGPLDFKNAVFDILAMDGPAYRHDSGNKINNYILDNIVRSENVARHGSLSGNAHPNATAIELQLVKVDASGRVTTFKSIGNREIGNEFADMTLSVNNGLNGRQALLIIFENIIRNAAKHDKEALGRLENNTLLFSVIFQERRDAHTGNTYYEITIADNKKNLAALKPKFSNPDGGNPSWIKDGRLLPLHILREDGGGIARDNKGIKEILISLAWLKYGERGKSGNTEINYDTLQNEPWEIVDVVGVDDRFRVYDFDAPDQPAGLSFGYRFHLAKYKNVHLLTREELEGGTKPLKETLADLPGASLYAVRQSDYDTIMSNTASKAASVLLSIPRLEPVPDRETEQSLNDRFDDLLEQNIKRRFDIDALPRLRISENMSPAFNDWNKQAVIRDQLGYERDWDRDHANDEFIHYRTHYETILDEAKDEAKLDLRHNAIFTEGISGGNFTHTLIRTNISRSSYLNIVEAALAKIAIVDERVFAKCHGRSPKERSRNPGQPDNPYWKYLEQKGVYILNSDENGIFDLRGYYISTGINASIVYDFLTIHLGLIDKTDAGENSNEAKKLAAALKQFGGRYVPGLTKLSVHSGRGGMTQVENIAFVPLSGIEWALDNCKYMLSDFFHGNKYPIFGEMPSREFLLSQAKPQKRKAIATAARDARLGIAEDRDYGEITLPYDAKVRKIFLFTTYTTGTKTLYGQAAGTIEYPDIERFASLDTIQEKAPDFADNFTCITHIDSQIFFYPCTKLMNRVVVPSERHDEFICNLTGKVLEAMPGKEAVELHLVLHASDSPQRREPNTKDTAHPLIEQIKSLYPDQVVNVTIWWFSHDGTGIHRSIVCDGQLFDGVNDKALRLLNQLAKHTNTSSVTAETGVSAVVGKGSAAMVDGQDVCVALKIPENFRLNNKTYLDRLATWQLGGAVDQAALNRIFGAPSDDKVFWNPKFSPDRCSERIKHPKPILVVGKWPLDAVGRDEQRTNYLDSSIWCRYISNEQEETAVRKQFARNHELGLYDCNNGLEYLEFQARMLVNARFGEFESSRHSKIPPVEFHSETEMTKKTAAIIKKLKDAVTTHPSSNHPLIWKILLVDDHSTKNLSRGKCSKRDVVCDVLASMFPIEIFDNKKYVPCPTKTRPELKDIYHIKIHCAETKEEALEFIRKQRFDMILLDYLLNKPEMTPETGRDFDTSDELLEEIKDSTQELERGPMGYLWFLNVSAFANAIDSKLTAKGLHYDTNEWHLNKGACPINTPELFKYNLLFFMTKQVDELVKFHKSKLEHQDMRSLVDLLRKIYMPEDGTTPRKMADLYFHSILNLEADCEIMRKDIDYGLSGKEKDDTKKLLANPGKSELVFSLFPDIIHYTKPFWDHLSHLVHITAYGSPQEWPQMLVNFREIKSTLLEANKGRNEQATKKLVQKIEEYIIDLHA